MRTSLFYLYSVFVLNLIMSSLLAFDYSTFDIIDGNFTWEEARIDAELRGGRLAVIDSAPKLQAFNDFLSMRGSWQQIWLGANNLSGGNWLWLNGAQMDYSNWHPNEPNYSGNYLNVYPSASYSGGLWDDAGSSDRFSYVIEFPYAFHSDDGSYQFIVGSYTRAEAFADAHSRGGRLAVFDTQAKVDTVMNLIKGLPQEIHVEAYFGLEFSEMLDTSAWLWANGSFLDEGLILDNVNSPNNKAPHFWYPGQPNNELEKYASLNYSGVEGVHDMPNSYQSNYILEQLSSDISNDGLVAFYNFDRFGGN